MQLTALLLVTLLALLACGLNGVMALSHSEMTSRAKKSGVISLTGEEFTALCDDKTRDFSVITMFTTSNPRHLCATCSMFESEFSLVESAYEKTPHGEEDRDVFFVKLDYTVASTSFMRFGVNRIPLLFHLPPHVTTEEFGEGAISDDISTGIPGIERFRASQSQLNAESVAVFLRDRTGISVQIERSKLGLYIGIVVAFTLLALAVNPVMNSLPFWLRIIRVKGLWMTASIGIYVCAISGLIFDIIRSPPLYNLSRSGKIEFFYPGSGQQYVAEGFIIGGLNFLCAAALIVAAVYGPKISSDKLRIVCLVGGICIFVFCFRLVRSFYVMKNPWYRP